MYVLLSYILRSNKIYLRISVKAIEFLFRSYLYFTFEVGTSSCQSAGVLHVKKMFWTTLKYFTIISSCLSIKIPKEIKHSINRAVKRFVIEIIKIR
jgi:hypothetical protein